MRKKILLSFILTALIIACAEAYAVDISAGASIDTNNVLIGDQITLKLEIKANPPVKIIWPAVDKQFGDLEIISESAIDTVKSRTGIKLSRKIVLAAYDSGTYVIPALTFMYEKDNSSALYPVRTDSIIVKYGTIEKLGSDIRDIKPIKEEPLTFMDYLPYILIIIAAMAGLIAFWFYYMKKKKKKLFAGQAAVKPEEPKIPADILAIAALEKLNSERLWQNGKIKLYHIRLSEIVRAYIERRFGIIALEMTTDEIIEAMVKTGVNQELISKLRETLALADLSKFAKFNPSPDENIKSMETSYELVDKTKESKNNSAQK